MMSSSFYFDDGVWATDGPPTRNRQRRRRIIILVGAVAVLLPAIIILAVTLPRGKGGEQQSSVEGNNQQQKPSVSVQPAPKRPVQQLTPSPAVTTSYPADTKHQPLVPITPAPSPKPTSSPVTPAPSPMPTTRAPFTVIVTRATPSPTPDPTKPPVAKFTPSPLEPFTWSPTVAPGRTQQQQQPESNITYAPGHLEVKENGLLLSRGLKSRIIAVKNQKVQYHNGGESMEPFHENPDFGSTFPVRSDALENQGGWVYASNSEMPKKGEGGVGAITFDKEGNVLNYEMVLTGTTMNCGGGATPWGSWVSCEELEDEGEIYQVDPFGKRKSEKTVVGEGKGRFESFTYDDRDKSQPRFFASEDRKRGALRRFTPTVVNWEDPWTMLHGDGVLEYLMIEPTFVGATEGRIHWTSDQHVAKLNAAEFYPESEGIDRDGTFLYMVCKREKWLFVLDLDQLTYKRFSTEYGVFDGSPDALETILGDPQDILYFTEESGAREGIHGRNTFGSFFTILEGIDYRSETTGLSFSPDGRHMYFAHQKEGVLFDIYREDGLPFFGKTLNVLYHNVAKVVLR